MESPYEGDEIASEEQGIALIATGGHTGGYSEPAEEEEGPPSWFDPTNFSLLSGVGYSFYKIETQASTPSGTQSFQNDNLSDPEADQFTLRLDISYRPFVSHYFTFGVFGGYQAIPSIAGHDVRGGLDLNGHYKRLSASLKAFYTHLWADKLDLVRESDGSQTDVEFAPDDLSLHGLGGSAAFYFGVLDYLRLGVFAEFVYHGSGIDMTDAEDTVMAVTPGVQAVVDF